MLLFLVLLGYGLFLLVCLGLFVIYVELGLLDVLFGGWCVVLLVCVMFADFWIVLFAFGCLWVLMVLWSGCGVAWIGGLLVWVVLWLSVLAGFGLVVVWYCLLFLF